MALSRQSEKQLLRKEKLHERCSLDARQRALADHAILERLEALPEYRAAKVIAAYASDGTEPDLMPLLKRAASEGKTVCLPRCRRDLCYEMAAADGAFSLVEGKWKMPEPPPCAGTVPDSELKSALWLVPGVAFDKNGGRLGRGKGIYDRLLEHAAGIVAGIFYECQKTAALPVEPHDRPLDLVVTERAVYRRKQQKPCA